MESEIVYFRRRASEERTAALQARDTQARRVHIALAEGYEDRVRSLVASQAIGRRANVSNPPRQRHHEISGFGSTSRRRSS